MTYAPKLPSDEMRLIAKTSGSVFMQQKTFAKEGGSDAVHVNVLVMLLVRLYGDVPDSSQKSLKGFYMTRVMRKPTLCICENKDADQLCGNRTADQRLCFRYIDSTIPLLPKSEISSL